MARDIEAFTDLFPEFAALKAGTINAQLSRAVRTLNANTFGDCYDDAVLYWAAHQVALSQARCAAATTTEDGAVVVAAAPGVVQSASVDGVSTSYALPKSVSSESDAEANFNKTPYGQEYLAIRESCIVPMRLIGGRTRSVVFDT